jgi:hypothetical protein
LFLLEQVSWWERDGFIPKSEVDFPTFVEQKFLFRFSCDLSNDETLSYEMKNDTKNNNKRKPTTKQKKTNTNHKHKQTHKQANKKQN